MEFLRFLEGLRSPLLDQVMGFLTHLGGEAAFMALAAAVFWCHNKRTGYFLLMTGFLGTLLNQFLKLVFRIPRPWVLDREFTIVESAREGASGYSFPSGHTQNAAGTFGGLARAEKNRRFRALMLALVALVAFSRMYLGVHTPLDVGVSLATGALLVLLLYPAFQRWYESPRAMNLLLGGMALLAAAYTLFCETNPWPADIDAQNLASGIKNGYLLTGAAAGMLLCYNLDRRYIRFETAAPPAAQAVKVAAGLCLLVGLKALLKPPLAAIFGGHPAADGLRYFLVVVFAAAMWPMSFRWISSLFNKRKEI